MCLILFAYDYHPKYKLIVAANRDEFYKRKALPAAFWKDNPQVLAGRDLQEGGTWMGITTNGRFAALTNYRDPAFYKPHRPSRGKLVSKYLTGNIEPETYLEKIADKANNYNGFNLLLGNLESLYYFSNYEKIVKKISSGIHGLSNNLLDVPWPKVKKGIEYLTNVVHSTNIDVEQLFSIMADQEQPDDHDLPNTGVGLEMEKMLAPIFISSPEYGTRATSVLLVDRNGYVNLWERSFVDKKPDIYKEVYFEFKCA